jgi:hypothetical protein
MQSAVSAMGVVWRHGKSDRGSFHLNSTKPKALRQTLYTDFQRYLFSRAI